MCFEYTPLPTIEYTPLPTNERRLTAKPTSSCTAPKLQPTIGVSIFRLPCVCCITAGPITKLFAWGGEDSGGHVLRDTTSL